MKHDWGNHSLVNAQQETRVPLGGHQLCRGIGKRIANAAHKIARLEPSSHGPASSGRPSSSTEDTISSPTIESVSSDWARGTDCLRQDFEGPRPII